MKQARVIATLLLLVCAGLAAGQGSTNAWTLSDKECVVFLGDSLTAHGGRDYGFVTIFRNVVEKRCPGKLINVICSGHGFFAVADLRKNLDRDALSYQPTIVVIEIGIADVLKEGADRPLRKGIFKMGIEDLVWRINRAGARVVLTTLTVIDEKIDGTNKYDPLVEEYSEIIREVAREKKCQLVDFRKEFMARLKQINKQNRRSEVLTTPAGIHLNPRGNKLVAGILLKAFGVAFEETDLETQR